MATRKIREIGDEVLTKPCKEVTKMNLRTKILISDMLDTMYEAMGVGLAARCLSVPGKAGQVTRPDHVKVIAQNEDMEEIELEGEGLLARAFCHEIDHLDGHLYVDLVEGELHDVEYADPEDEEEV